MANTTNKDKAKEAIAEGTERVKDNIAQGASRATDVASSVADKANEFGQTVADKAGQISSALADKTATTVSSVGSSLKNAGGALRENLPKEGVVGSASESVAGVLEKSGQFLEEKGLAGLSSGVTDVIKRNPVPSVLIALGVGFLLASATRSR